MLRVCRKPRNFQVMGLQVELESQLQEARVNISRIRAAWLGLLGTLLAKGFPRPALPSVIHATVLGVKLLTPNPDGCSHLGTHLKVHRDSSHFPSLAAGGGGAE